MSVWEFDADNAIERLESGDDALQCINLFYIDPDKPRPNINRLAECLATLPNAIRQLYLNGASLPDAIGVTLAKFVASSSTIELLALQHNEFGADTYLAMADAMRVNTSLHVLHLEYNRRDVDRALIDDAFVYALRLNPNRRAGSFWRLYEIQGDRNDYDTLRAVAEQLGRPHLQMLLWDRA